MRGRRPKGQRLLVSSWARSYACFACAPKVIVLAAHANPMPPILIRSLLLALLIAPAQAQPQTWAWDDGTVPYVNRPVEIVERMMRMAEVRAGDFVIDLGSGDGRIVIEAAKRGARGLGVDLDPALVKLATQNAQP